MFFLTVCHMLTILYVIIHEASTEWAHEFKKNIPASDYRSDTEHNQGFDQKIPDRSPFLKPTHFEIRAVLVKCSYSEHTTDPALPHPVKLLKSPKILKETDMKCRNSSNSSHPQIEKCKKKVLVTVVVHNSGVTDCKNQYVVIDHVFDPITNCKVRLYHPYVLKLKQHPVLQSYKLILDQTVNAKAKEEVHNKEEEGYKGCQTGGTEPTCEPIVHNGEPVPFSSGFCCSCDVKRYNEPLNTDSGSQYSVGERENRQEADGLTSQLDNEYEDLKNLSMMGLDDLQTPFAASRRAIIESVNGGLSKLSGNYKKFGQEKKRNAKDRTSRSGRFVRKQKRGGQNCDDKYSPPGVDQDSYQQSAHCLKFSDIWYSVYHFEKPVITYSIAVQVFEKFQDENCNVRWHDLSKDVPLTVGTDKAHAQNSGPTLAITYYLKTPPHLFCPSIDVNQKLIMIPDLIKGGNVGDAPEVSGGPQEFLVVPKESVSADGRDCDRAGVGFEAFNKQPNRCSAHQGSCLRNQPSDFWKHDHEADQQGEKGSYFLKFYGRLPEKPLKENCDDHSRILSMYYEGEFANTLELEFLADHNTVLRPHSLAIITEVYIDSSNGTKTDIRVKVVNSGLVASIFYISLGNCPLDMPASFNNIASKPALIAPQHQHIFNLNVECDVPDVAFHCTVNVLNTKQEVIAGRRVRIEPLDRCVCAWYCRCACLVTDGGMKCHPFTLDCFSSAGFQGSLPVPIQLVEYTLMDDVLCIMLYLCVFLCSTLLVMGLTKALVGWLCLPAVGRWGFDVLLDAAPGHRRACAAHQAHAPPATEFCLNLVFFFVYPVMLLAAALAGLCGSRGTREGCERCYAEGRQWCGCGHAEQSCTCLPYTSQGPQEEEEARARPADVVEEADTALKCGGDCGYCKCT